ncbi:uncharacterized protein LOC131613169 [Vicia villosa]|uniref:uncharacterized protein LOC131613169 n=1 Tax=Vicia villosa TaxID=3911 RepID=UPI00273BB9F8|nr:uncharacterized protein LOC131613169 [Vicia villosa]
MLETPPIQGHNSMWFNVLKSRYGDLSSKVMGGETEKRVSCSIWWKDILRLNISSSQDPFASCINFKVHNDFNTLFWESIWLEDSALKECFPALYQASLLKNVSVAAMGGWMGGVWRWSDFGLSATLVDMADHREEFLELKNRVEAFRDWKSEKDLAFWSGNVDRNFSVASCYAFYDRLRIPFGPPVIHAEVFDFLWKMEIPFKIKAFGWRIFHDRLPTKDLLAIRGMSFSSDDSKCIFCGYCSESSNHIFFGCLVVKNIWREIAFWVGKRVNIEDECRPNFMEWYHFFRSLKVKDRKSSSVWLATTWTIWLIRNGSCFRKEPWNVNNAVWNIKLLVWKWSFCGKITHPNYSFYEFSMNPLYYLS